MSFNLRAQCVNTIVFVRIRGPLFLRRFSAVRKCQRKICLQPSSDLLIGSISQLM